MIDQDAIYLTVYEYIGQKIKEHREKKSLTQDDLAKNIDVSRTSIANYESGKQAIYISDLYSIAIHLELNSINELLPLIEFVKKKSSLENLINSQENLDDKKKKELKEFVKKHIEVK